MSVAELIINIASAYAVVGIVFAAVFVSFGVGEMDPAARGAGLGFRLLIFPGASALWPLLLTRWVRGQQAPPEESNAHRRIVPGSAGGHACLRTDRTRHDARQEGTPALPGLSEEETR